ncbi:MAG TPA: PIN domain nuclease [Flavobacteriales bacterium]|nr:PIN domain nuclease [Flavobacteriales bacterium]HCA82638.1 PIN domain nuclease [Flavobacteriales bacterium]HRE75366.1 PIN domain-containing protein [Flavobacteriales bacterium]HRE95806.1 PIN domain-containing protein [Flavobacteriales bacterium]HRJ37573.1 PIN domain-containing protein [Flavobacteriales bacterium]
MVKVFVDTDVCLDLLSGRQPFNAKAEQLFTLAEKGKLKICVSSLSFSNIDYILQSQFSKTDSRKIIGKFRTLVSVLSVDSKIIDRSIASDFPDFEDAIQYHTALESGISILLTRNLKDYKKARIQVMSPDVFLLGL